MAQSRPGGHIVQWIISCIGGAFLLIAPRTFAAQLDGFVTKQASWKQFDMGATHIELNSRTQCKAETLGSTISLQHNSIFSGVPAHNSFVLHDRTIPSAGKVTPCESLRIEAVTRVRVFGSSVSRSGVYLATQVTVYSVTIVEDIPAVGSDHGWIGGALLEEKPRLIPTASGWTWTMWVDGYPAKVTPDTTLLTAPPGTRMVYGSSGFFDGSRPKTMLSKEAAPPFSGKLFQANTWASYRGLGVVNGSLLLYRLRLWPNRVGPEERKYLDRLAPVIKPPDYSNHVSGNITFPDAGSHDGIQVPADHIAQTFVTKLGDSLIPRYQFSLPEKDETKIHFRFYVVQPHGKTLLKEVKRLDGLSFLQRPSWDEAVVKLPDGVVLIPSHTLADIDCSAQLASLLSYSVTSILQKQSYMAKPGIGTSLDAAVVAIAQYESAIRIGIRQMYLAGYDIREAPFAWAVAQGKPVANPVIDSKHPDKEIPWYAAYAFNYISQYYKDVDYSKLKRGRREYQQFLQELYKADPSLPQAGRSQ
jgi:hypothetical protein